MRANDGAPSVLGRLLPGWIRDLPPPALLIVTLSALIVVHRVATSDLFRSLSLLAEYVLNPAPRISVPADPLITDDDAVSVKASRRRIDLRDGDRPDRVQCFDPSTLHRLGDAPAMTEREVNDLCSKAAEAQKTWRLTSYARRRLVLRTVQKYIVSHQEEICRACARDSGKPKLDALLGEVMTTCEKIRCVNANGEAWLSPRYRPTGPLMVHKAAYVEYAPLGVLGVIAPWNYPFHNLMNHVISGIFSGNAVVVKVSEHTSWSSSYFLRIIRRALEANGHDADLVQAITGFGEAGEALVSCSTVDKVIFTGSPGVGRKVMEGCAESVKPVVLELGGKDPMVVCDDVKIEDVIPWALRGCYQNCGQNCCGVERIYAYESVHDSFLSSVLPRVEALRQGVPLATCGHSGEVDCGSMVAEDQIGLIQDLVDDAVSKGATLHCGGRRNPHLPGQFYEPTVLSGITAEMRISSEEVFGPVMCVVKVPRDDDDECVRMINSCPFGLGASVYSADGGRGLSIGERIRSGMLTVNDFGANYLVQSLPFGGVGESGFGRFAGPEGLRGCCLERSVVIDRIPGIRTTIPSRFDYPVDVKRAVPFGMDLIGLLYDESPLGKMGAMLGLIRGG